MIDKSDCQLGYKARGYRNADPSQIVQFLDQHKGRFARPAGDSFNPNGRLALDSLDRVPNGQRKVGGDVSVWRFLAVAIQYMPMTRPSRSSSSPFVTLYTPPERELRVR